MDDAEETLRCSICHEIIVDPRSLPCGHCYCGPPRSCLKLMENDGQGTMTCAICRSDFNLQATDRNPLYGVRDFCNRTISSFQSQKPKGITCAKHPSNNCILWCTKCDVNVCEACIQDDHDEHPVRNLRKHLTQTIERKLGNNLNDGLLSYYTSLEECIQLNNSLLTGLERRVGATQSFLENVAPQRKALGRYFDSIKQTGNKDGFTCELSLLSELSKNDFSIGTLEASPAASTTSIGVQAEASKKGTTTQTESGVRTSSNTQTETSLYIVSEPELEKHKISRIPLNPWLRVTDLHLQRSNLFIEREVLTLHIERCTTTIEFGMEVRKRKPSIIAPSNVAHLGGFKLQLLAYSRLCDACGDKSNCPEPQLCLKVQRTRIQDEKIGRFTDLDRCKIELINNKSSSKNIVSNWYNLNEDREQTLLLYSTFLRRSNSWIDSNEHFHLKVHIEFYM